MGIGQIQSTTMIILQNIVDQSESKIKLSRKYIDNSIDMAILIILYFWFIRFHYLSKQLQTKYLLICLICFCTNKFKAVES